MWLTPIDLAIAVNVSPLANLARASSRRYLVSFGRRPNFTPRALARTRPSFVRDRSARAPFHLLATEGCFLFFSDRLAPPTLSGFGVYAANSQLSPDRTPTWGWGFYLATLAGRTLLKKNGRSGLDTRSAKEKNPGRSKDQTATGPGG
jgi:hypothetical protein